MQELTQDELARSVFIHGPVVVFRWRNDPGWPVELCTLNVLEVFGHSAEAFLEGRVAYADCVAPEDLARVQEEVVAATNAGLSTFEHEPYRIRRADGSIRWLYDFTRILRDEDGRATHYLGYVIDVTSRVQAQVEKQELERQLLHAQKLESLGVLAGGVAHDFNNLLTGILGQTQLAQLAVTANPARALEHLREIEALSLRAAEFTRQLLAYTGRGQLVVEPLDLGELARSMFGMLRVLVSKNAQLQIDVEPDVPAMCGDRAQLQQIVLNLVTNASDALGEASGSLRVSVRRELGPAWEACADVPAGEKVVLEVSDDGCGMDDDARTRLFEPFFTTKATGRGLGLSAVMGIVRGHEGAIHVRSAPGAGTSFLLVFPACDEQTPARPSAPAPSVWRGQGVALVVDDEAAVREAACAMLQHLGFTTLAADNGAEALALLETHHATVAMVLLDRTMPVLGGADTMARLRERWPALPVVMTSGFDVGAPTALDKRTRFLPKPYRLSELRAVLEDVMR
ncbi:MAG: PAS domain-containing protein [Sandaracinus sp.]|nr:PAS domain-containing protein [Sandaracinus sp.]